MFDALKIRNDFPIFTSHNGKGPLIYFDNAASTQKPRQVIDAISNFYCTSYANVHRSPHRLGAEATDMFEGSRIKVAQFLGSPGADELIFTRGTTEAINLVAGIMAQQLLQPGDVVLLTIAEHHSNLIPWQMACKRTGAKLEFAPLLPDGHIDVQHVKDHWNPKTVLFSFQHASNVLGTVNPVKELCSIAHSHGAIAVVDGAQSAPHVKVDVEELDCDFYAVSAHKMCGPTGIGALWGRRELLDRFDPIFGGGEMINKVDLDKATYNVPPFKFESGTPNIAGAIGFGAAVDYLEAIGLDNIEKYVCELGEYAFDKFSAIEGVTVYGPPRDRTGAVSFWVEGVHPHDVASVMDMSGICIRAGHHCAEPLMRWLDKPATARASLYIYNTRDEIDIAVSALKEAQQVMGYVAH